MSRRKGWIVMGNDLHVRVYLSSDELLGNKKGRLFYCRTQGHLLDFRQAAQELGYLTVQLSQRERGGMTLPAYTDLHQVKNWLKKQMQSNANGG